ncbi:MAG TPA: HNH endonuclease signature motif containing protein, partial [Yaniella sp.]
LRQQQAAMDAALTHFAGHVEAVIDDQQTMLGAPEGIKPYRNGTAYFREVLKLSTAQTKKILARVPYVTWTPGKDPGWLAYQPAMPELAASFAKGNISGENLDRIVGLDQDLTKYVHKTNALPEDKADVMAAFEPALVDAAETATPDELSKEKTRWANLIAHALDPDGPPVADAIRKQADNALRTRRYADGSGRATMHMTPALFALFQNWSLHQLNANGTAVELDPEVINLLNTSTEDEHEQHTTGHHHQDDPADQPTTADTFNDLNDLHTTPHPDARAEDDEGNTISADQAAGIDELTTGQRLAAIVLGMFHNILTMDPAELGAKSAHGTSAQLMIIQDIQTAYETLGVGALPEAVRRPPGPAGILPPTTSQPNPDDPDTPVCEDPTHTRGRPPPSWTQYMSEAINIGAFHPRHAEQLACDSKLVGQIWNGHHDVLVQHRAKRLFTPAQRRAILARDRGCQAPGCTVPAVYCQIHHIIEWLNGGTTNIDNAITVCALHHGAIHDGKWRIRKRHGVTFFQPAPWLDPTQPLLRNLYWNF